MRGKLSRRNRVRLSLGDEVRTARPLSRQVVGLCQDHIEKRCPLPSSDLAKVTSPASSLSSELSKRERSVRLREALDKLPAGQRAASILRYFEGLSSREIAESLSITPRAVERLLARARQTLAREISDCVG